MKKGVFIHMAISFLSKTNTARSSSLTEKPRKNNGISIPQSSKYIDAAGFTNGRNKTHIVETIIQKIFPLNSLKKKKLVSHHFVLLCRLRKGTSKNSRKR